MPSLRGLHLPSLRPTEVAQAAIDRDHRYLCRQFHLVEVPESFAARTQLKGRPNQFDENEVAACSPFRFPRRRKLDNYMGAPDMERNKPAPVKYDRTVQTGADDQHFVQCSLFHLGCAVSTAQ
jgi:hypothetical protein